MFLSDVQPNITTTAHLDAIHRLGRPKPRSIRFSYGRELPDMALEAWHGQKDRLQAFRCVRGVRSYADKSDYH